MIDRQRLKNEYKELYQKITDIFLRHDPVKIVDKNNIDEYDQEVSAILPKLKDCKSKEDVLEVVYKVFLEYFDTAINGDSKSRYGPIANEIWSLKEQSR